MVEDLLTRPEFTKEQKIDAMELLGASLATKELRDADVANAFEYMKHGMEERFQDPCHPLLKKAVERVQSHYDQKESQTLEELARMEGDFDAIVLESLYIKERILGSGNYQFLYLIRSLATHYERSRNFDICLRFRRHAREVNQCYNHSAGIFDIEHFIRMLYNMILNKYPLRQNLVLEVLQKTVLELGKELAAESLGTLKRKNFSNYLVDYIVGLLQIFGSDEPFEEDKNPCILVALQKLVGSNLRNDHGNTLLHLAADGQHRMTFYPLIAKDPSPFSFPCAKTVKLLLNMGFDVNAINNDGDTHLHRAVTFEPSNDNIHLMTDTLEVLLDGGAHHDFVNNDGKTATDMAQTDEARWILSERKTLELKCIAARAVKKVGLPYLGVVPKTLEKYISMH